MTLSPSAEFSVIVAEVKNHFKGCHFDERDGLWIAHQNGWVQVRKSNTEPIIRIYAEGHTVSEADSLADTVIEIVKKC